MTVNQIERSNYFRGLLFLIGNDGKIQSDKKEILDALASVLGFNQDYVEQELNDFIGNLYIAETPPKFSNHILAETFLKDGIRIAFEDKALHISELKWLVTFSAENYLSKQWFFVELENFLDNYDSYSTSSFEIQKYLQA